MTIRVTYERRSGIRIAHAECDTREEAAALSKSARKSAFEGVNGYQVEAGQGEAVTVSYKVDGI
jgi:hypothetical protein